VKYLYTAHEKALEKCNNLQWKCTPHY